MTLSERMERSAVDSPTYSPLRAHTFGEGTGEYCARCKGTRLAVFGRIGDRRTPANAVHPEQVRDGFFSPFVARALAGTLPPKVLR